MILNGLVNVYINQSRYYKAFTILETVLHVRPNDDLILAYLSRLFRIKGDIDQAAHYADRSLSINTDNRIALLEGGEIA